MYVFMNMVITRAKNWCPDMILKAFDVKVHGEKDEIPPEACRPSTKLKQNNVEKVDPQKVKKTTKTKMSIKRVYIY